MEGVVIDYVLTPSPAVTAAITGGTPGETYWLFDDSGAETSDVADPGGSVTLSIVPVGTDGLHYGVYVQRGGASSSEVDQPIIGTAVYEQGTAGLFDYGAVWGTPDTHTVQVTFDSVLGYDYAVQIIDNHLGGSEVNTGTGTGSSLMLSVDLDDTNPGADIAVGSYAALARGTIDGGGFTYIETLATVLLPRARGLHVWART